MATAAPLEFLPPRLDRRVLALSRPLLPLMLRRGSRVVAVEVEGGDRLVEEMRAFQAGQTRLFLAFRHPSVDDPLTLAHLLWRDLPRLARQRGLRWRTPPHAQFLYDRGIPLWAGEGVGWMLSRLGGCSIQRGKLDLPALRTARSLLLDGPYPFAAAPEGATNGHNEAVSALEPGVAQLAFWTADDLRKAQRPERMRLLPIGIQYTYTGPVWEGIERLLGQLERETGLVAGGRGHDPESLYARLFVLAERTLTLMEDFYRQGYHQGLPPLEEEDPNLLLAGRLQRLLDTALKVVENGFAIESRGELADRCRRLEQAGWDRLYPNGGTGGGEGTAAVCALQRGLADRLAEETERRMWHMRMVECFVAVSGAYVRERPSQERFADTLLLLWDLHRLILGGDPGRRPRLGPRRALVRIDEPIAVDELVDGYHNDRRGAVAALTATLQRRLEALIVPTRG